MATATRSELPSAHLIEGSADAEKPEPPFETSMAVTAPNAAAAASPLPAYVAVKVPDEPPAHVMVGGADGL